MAALDKYHESDIHALQKDGWTITHNPFALTIGDRTLQVDLVAERFLAAERGMQKIAVVIKTFGGASLVTALQQAIGQYGQCEDVLSLMKPDRMLYLGFPKVRGGRYSPRKLGNWLCRNVCIVCSSIPRRTRRFWNG